MLASSGVKVSILGVTALWDDCMAFPANQGSKNLRDFSGLEMKKKYRVVSNLNLLSLKPHFFIHKYENKLLFYRKQTYQKSGLAEPENFQRLKIKY